MPRLSRTLVATLLVCATLSQSNLVASTVTLRITVAAGNHDRHSAPVQTTVWVPGSLAETRSAALIDADGHRIIAQLCRPRLLSKDTAARDGQQPRELHWILPMLKAGESVDYSMTFLEGAEPNSSFVWQDTAGNYRDLRYGQRPVLRYIYAQYDNSTEQNRVTTYKVYHHLFDPSGTRTITKGPGGLYPHQRGLSFGNNHMSYLDVERVNTWDCPEGEYLSHEGFLAEEAGPVLGRHRVAIDWHGLGGKTVFASEQREMTVYHVPGGQMLEFATRLISKVGKITARGNEHHAGFQFRADQQVAAKNQALTYFLRPDGKGAPGETRNPPDSRCTNMPWNAMRFVLDEKRYTALYLDTPANPKSALFGERSYGLFGAAWQGEWDQVLELNYRLWLQDGEMTVEQAAAMSADFADPPQVTVHVEKRPEE